MENEVIFSTLIILETVQTAGIVILCCAVARIFVELSIQGDE